MPPREPERLRHVRIVSRGKVSRQAVTPAATPESNFSTCTYCCAQGLDVNDTSCDAQIQLFMTAAARAHRLQREGQQTGRDTSSHTREQLLDLHMLPCSAAQNGKCYGLHQPADPFTKQSYIKDAVWHMCVHACVRACVHLLKAAVRA